MIFENISLQKFGRLLASFPVGVRNRRVYWACLCDCTNVKVVRVDALLHGFTQSCGCLQREAAAAQHGKDNPNFTHGHSSAFGNSPTYTSWHLMIQRCANPNATGWLHYGGAGITVCDRWMKSFEAFLDDMGQRPSAKHSLSRFLDSGDYEPGNVAWGTKADQVAEAKGKRAMLVIHEVEAAA